MPARKVPPCVIDNPFHRLDNGTYLHDRPEKDVHKLLIDCYRMKLDDDYTFDGDVAEDSLYGGAAPTKGFKRFLRQAERRAGVLPNWWNAGKAKECVATGARKDEEWTSLHAAVEKSDINDHHKNPQMAMQLRMLAEGITGRGPGGQDSAPMRKMMMSMESGSFQGESSMMDASKMFK